jgi:hypothetical protein
MLLASTVTLPSASAMRAMRLGAVGEPASTTAKPGPTRSSTMSSNGAGRVVATPVRTSMRSSRLIASSRQVATISCGPEKP